MKLNLMSTLNIQINKQINIFHINKHKGLMNKTTESTSKVLLTLNIPDLYDW